MHILLEEILSKKKTTTEKQVDAIISFVISNKKKYELKQIEGIFPQSFMNDLTRAKLKEIDKLQDTIKKDYLIHKSKCGKLIVSVNIHYLLLFKGYR